MAQLSNMILRLLAVLLYASCGHSAAPGCCSNIEHPVVCRHACEQFEVSGSQIQQMQQLVTAAEKCPESVVEFWQCVNSSLPVLKSLQAWSGRPCCEKALSESCSTACWQAHSKEDIKASCDSSIESVLYSCVDRQKAGKHCCPAESWKTCYAACQNFYLMDGMNNKQLQQKVHQFCPGSNQNVAECIENQLARLAKTITDSLPCCDRAETPECQETCRNTLVFLKSEEDKIDEVIKGCGPPSPMKPMWQCFLRPPTNRKKNNLSIIDGAKLQCCPKAVTTKCMELCIKTFSSRWSDSSKKFHEHCYYHQALSVIEAPLQMCLREVEEPCRLGCSGLQFCTNFNNRPVELFRSCDAKADEAARLELRQWQNGVISLPQMKIPVKDIMKCEHGMWKAIACALQVKPCHGKPGPTSICREDCVFILNKCINYKELPHGKNVSILCKALPSRYSKKASCISISHYLKESPHKSRLSEVTNPCNSNPCNENHICLVKRRKCKHPSNCHSYICKPACPMGKVSTQLVPRGSYVRLPMLEGKKLCHKVCHCGHRNKIDHCRPMACLKEEKCVVSPEHIKEHHSHFKFECNQCICHSGEVICTKRRCPVGDVDLDQRQYTGLPCNCPAHHTPVCGANGKTYPNTCLAECAGLKAHEYEYGNCSFVDPCQDSPCSSSYRCIPRRQVCLSLNQQPCRQFECISKMASCSHHHHHDPVCDTLREEFANLCVLFDHDRTLAYRGHCLNNCRNTGIVCGHNGETYVSECAAFSDKSTIDYKGPCRAVGQLSVQDLENSKCADIPCPEIRPKSCKPLTPPGGCCPICAAEMRVLFSPSLADMAAQAARVGPITTRNVTDKLSELITVMQCDVFGYLSIEGDLVVLILPITEEPTDLQVEACNREAERLQHLIQTGSPAVMSHLSLTPLLVAPLRMPSVTPVGTANRFMPTLTIVVVVLTSVITIGCS